jgi:hypothetical protein
LFTIIAAGIGLAGRLVAEAGSTIADNGCWKIVPSPNVEARSSSLGWVSVVSANDVWASGDYNSAVGESTVHPVSKHWDGSQWSIVPAPAVGTMGTRIQGISAASANDVWMVGAYDLTATNPDGPKTLVEHWDGTQWSVVPSPNPTFGIRGSYLRGVEALSANNVWAVGYLVYPVALIQTLIEHWDGAQWTIVSSPNGMTGGGLLHAVRGLAPNDIWAVGWAGRVTLALHWDGSQWSIIPTPSPSSGSNFLYGVAPVSSDDVWAVGVSDSGPLTMHWDGTEWLEVPNPLVPGQTLQGVTAISTNDVWAIGYAGSSADNKTLAIHWDGVAWTVVPTEALGGNYFFGIDSISASDVWAVGTGTLTEHFKSPCVSELTPARVVSRKSHGSGGTFDVDLPLDGSGIECRSGGGNSDYTIVFTFPNALTSVGGANVTGGAGMIQDSAIGNDAHEYIINLTGLTNAQTISISLTDVNDSIGNFSSVVSASMSVLIGDSTSDGSVNSADIAQTKSQSGQTVTSSNFREDLSADGTLNSADIALAKSKSGTGLP